MWLPWDTRESAKERHQRLLNARIEKAKFLNLRIQAFIKDVTASTIYNDSEKKKILNELKFLKTS